MALHGFLRNTLFAFLRKISRTDDARDMVAETLRGLLATGPQLGGPGRDGESLDLSPPYADLGRAPPLSPAAQRDDVVFITARFRSGSTLVWNLFRHMPGVTAYYEPFNERRWFDRAFRGAKTDPTHRQVEEYWREYDGLEELGQYYREDWTRRNLLMQADFWDPDMLRYVELLIERAPGRPALQFNRIDFRLPWFRRNFPHARLLHVYRHPRDQWCSTLVRPEAFPSTAPASDFAQHDGFYLGIWARDLDMYFPFLVQSLSEHPYRTFYYIWRLSYLFGRRYADYSLGYEHLVDHPEDELPRMLDWLGMDESVAPRLRSLVERPNVGRWKRYADDAWFRRHEEHCERVLTDFLGPACRTVSLEHSAAD